MLDQRYFWHQGMLYREMNSWERENHDSHREHRAEQACKEFLYPKLEIGDELTSTHTSHTHGRGEPAPCILLDVNKFGFGEVLLATYREILSEYNSEEEIVTSQTNGHGLTLVRKCPFSLDELLCHDFEQLRELGLNLIEHRELRKKYLKMSKKRRISKFRSSHSEPELEYAIACPSETFWYRQGFQEGYRTALEENEELHYGIP